jgi:tripartite-type tricarboxylate transporter receptor subunit TctC
MRHLGLRAKSGGVASRRTRVCVWCGGLGVATHLLGATASADDVADFYRGKTITMAVGFSPGGDYDLRLRMVGRHIGRYIPGNPTVVVNNMPGGGGLVVANWLANIAPRDGTVVVAITQSLPVLQAMGTTPGVKFDVRRFGFIGNTTDTPDVLNSWYTTGIRTIQDARERELVVGASGVASGSYMYPHALNLLAGTKFKIVTGYAGGNDINLAMERGEVGGRGSNSWAAWKMTRPNWLVEKKVNILVQVGLRRNPELADVPLMQESTDNNLDRQLLRFISAGTAMSRSLVTSPDVPRARLAALRQAFEATVKDPDFLEEASKTQTDLSIGTGTETQEIADSIVATPSEVIARANLLLDTSGK